MTCPDIDVHNESYLKFLDSGLRIFPVGHSAVTVPAGVEGGYQNKTEKQKTKRGF